MADKMTYPENLDAALRSSKEIVRDIGLGIVRAHDARIGAVTLVLNDCDISVEDAADVLVATAVDHAVQTAVSNAAGVSKLFDREDFIAFVRRVMDEGIERYERQADNAGFHPASRPRS